MDKYKKGLKGSASRDTFKQMHKQLDSSFYAIDLDLVLIDRHKIIAFLDFKKEGDGITWAEKIAYHSLHNIAPVYIIMSRNPEKGPFTVWEYNVMQGIQEFSITTIHVADNYEQLGEWERKLRNCKEK